MAKKKKLTASDLLERAEEEVHEEALKAKVEEFKVIVKEINAAEDVVRRLTAKRDRLKEDLEA